MLLCGMATAQNHSVMASGQWWRLTVDADGVYCITTREIPALQGADIDGLAVYGRGGAMLSTENYLTSTADMQDVRIDIRDHNGNRRFDSGDELLFYGEGAGGWSYDSGLRRWVHTTHAYAAANHYFLTTGAAQPSRIATVPAVEPDTVMDSHTVVAIHDNDMVNIYRSGQVWVGERFSTSQPQRTFEVRLPGTDISDVKLRYAVASTATSRADFTLGTTGFSRQESTSEYTPYRTTIDQLSASQASYTFTLRFSTVDNAGLGYLDYIELNAHAALAFGGGQTVVRNERHQGSTARFAMSGLGNARVWDVTDNMAVREMDVSANAWTDSTNGARTYVVFDEYSYLTPVNIAEVANQDLHGAPEADLVIVTLEAYRDQAERLAALHELFDGMATLVVSDQEVFNEYSSGMRDPMAIRSLLRDLKQRHPARPPRYLILFGKGTYDNRNLLGSSVPTMVTYETVFSFDSDGNSYASDDMLGYLSATGHGSASETLEVSVGRMPAKNSDEATLLVDKVERYLTRKDLDDEANRGDWRNYVALLADDADPGRPGDTTFAHSSETIAEALKASMPQINIDRLYADAYHQESGSIGSYYPDLNNALRQRINYGCLLLNYIGHGSTEYIGTERYIEPSHITGYTNGDRMPFFVTSTCSYGRFDQVDELCGAEICVLAPSAMIGVISATRPISHIERFNRDVVLFALDPANTVGDALRMAKNRTITSMSINLLGDPALRLSQPANRIKVTHINAVPVDDTEDIQADVLSRVTVTGEIQDSTGALLEDFDGTIYPIVFDREMRSTTLANDNPGTEVSFWQQKNVLYRGSHAVQGGRFEYSFLVPRDVSYQYAYAKLSHYAKSAYEHATGSFSHLMLGGMSDTNFDASLAPDIRLFMGDTNFRDGGLTGPSPTLVALLSDSAGINIGTGLGHDITAVVDDNPNSLIVLNDLYQPDISDSRCGSVAYTLRDLAPGRHTVTVKAWNIFGVSSTATVPFVVRGLDTLTHSDLSVAPNPSSTRMALSLRINNPAAIASVELQIYNARGQMAYRCTPAVSAEGFIVGPVVWDVSSVPPGLYLARMVMTDTDGETHHATTKCIVR